MYYIALFYNNLYHLLQKQPNFSDCGVFAIAFAVSICAGRKPQEQAFHVHAMRQHFLKCLEDKKITHFPSRKRKCVKFIKREEVVNVYCICRYAIVTCICCTTTGADSLHTLTLPAVVGYFSQL